ncbi:MAG: PP2C family protein-serine/threonine phosphatase [Desulfosalsimonas sp.]
MECRIFSAMMIGPRSRQEDCIIDGTGLLQADLLNRKKCLCTQSLLLVVCDGMGGHQGGQKASRFVCERMKKIAWPEKMSGSLIHKVLLDIQSAAETQLPPPSGTTIAGLGSDGTRTAIFNAGDSRVYRVTKKSMDYLSHDHSLVQDLVDQCMMNAESASMHPLKHMIGFGLGPVFSNVWSVRDLHIVERQNQPDCSYLICTDGLTDIMSDKEIHGILAESPVENGARLAEAAKKKGLTDNTSFIIARIR